MGKWVGRPRTSVTAFTYPILGSLSHESTLITTGRGVSLHGMPAGTDEIVELGKLDDDGIPVIFVEGALFEVFLNKGRFQPNVRLFLFAKINF